MYSEKTILDENLSTVRYVLELDLIAEENLVTNYVKSTICDQQDHSGCYKMHLILCRICTGSLVNTHQSRRSSLQSFLLHLDTKSRTMF